MAENREHRAGSLAERLGWDRTGRSPSSAAPPAPSAPPEAAAPPAARVRTPARSRAGQGGPVGRHCWVVDCPEAPGRWPGLLLEWVRERDGWRGKVVMIADGDLGPVMLTLWVAGDHLRPV